MKKVKIRKESNIGGIGVITTSTILANMIKQEAQFKGGKVNILKF